MQNNRTQRPPGKSPKISHKRGGESTGIHKTKTDTHRETSPRGKQKIKSVKIILIKEKKSYHKKKLNSRKINIIALIFFSQISRTSQTCFYFAVLLE
jgi:hypothetical protein